MTNHQQPSGNNGARKLIPMPPEISCAPALPLETPPFIALPIPGAQNQPGRPARPTVALCVRSGYHLDEPLAVHR